MKRALCLFVAVFFLLMAGFVWAQEKRASAAQARMWVEKGEKYIQEHGLKKGIAEFNKPVGPFIKDDLYLSVVNFEGLVLAMPKNPKLVGQNRISVQDPDGKYLLKEIITVAKTKGSGWVDYKYRHPQTKKIEQKTTYVRKIGDNMVLYCGAYK